ncbi:MAG: type II secretion system minor pseudopilin GspH [Steroidobacteraceae bacterium]
MGAHAHRDARTGGFTLLEMLVVLAIIGIVTAGVLLSLNLGGHDVPLDTAAHRLHALMRYAREQGELQTRDYGIVFEREGYLFVVFSERHNAWRQATGDSALRARRLPAGVRLTVVVDGREVKLRAHPEEQHGALAPQVMLYSSGDISSFRVTLERPGTHRGFVIRPDRDGRIVEQPLKGSDAS